MRTRLTEDRRWIRGNFFRTWPVNYFEFFERGDDIRLLWNAVVSMNSVAEYLALHQQNYARISQNKTNT
jgi:hypothetical protein